MKKFLLILLLSIIGGNSFAQDRLFTYTYQSNVLKKDIREVEVWNTIRWGKSEFYRAFDHRIEYELGLGSNLQTAFYLNINTFSQDNLAGSLASGTKLSFSNEWKYKLSDPVANAVGSALYAEIGVGTDELELEGKLILDKKIGRSIHVLNVIGELEYEKEFEDGEFETEQESKIELDYGFSHQISKKLNVGFELRQDNGIHHGKIESASLFGGPGFSYNGNNYWINFTLLPQVYSFKGADSGNLDLNHHEKVETRLIFSFQL
ncbi:MAG: hypothetical protein ABI390_11175 [Daejeonella sp.]